MRIILKATKPGSTISLNFKDSYNAIRTINVPHTGVDITDSPYKEFILKSAIALEGSNLIEIKEEKESTKKDNSPKVPFGKEVNDNIDIPKDTPKKSSKSQKKTQESSKNDEKEDK